MRSLLILALISCSPDQARNSAEAAAPSADSGNAIAAAGSANAMAVSPAFHEDFRTAYASVLWTMMVLRWCDRRWARPKETAAAEARLKAIDKRAVKLGLRPQMDQAAHDNAQQMAVMRLDVHCSGGFDRFHAQAQRALTNLEHLMRKVS